MTQRASSVGELALRLLTRGRRGTVTRVFERSAYVKTGTDFLLLLWGETRSPMTVNFAGGSDGSRGLEPGEGCELSRSGLTARTVKVVVGGAKVYRSSLLTRSATVLPDDEILLKGAAALKALYDASPHAPILPADRSFREFVNDILIPFPEGGGVPTVYDFLGLVGRGGGFTPAGDDFTAGFTAAFNFLHRSKGTKGIAIPKAIVASKTVPESAAILVYSSQGYVDEGLEKMIVDSVSGNRSRYLHDVMTIASRGHTSGMDMSLGVLLAEASISDAASRSGVLKKCLHLLWAE